MNYVGVAGAHHTDNGGGYARVVVADAVALVIGIAGLGGLVFTALRYRRDDTTAIVTQQSTIVHDMETLTAGLRAALADCEEHARRAD